MTSKNLFIAASGQSDGKTTLSIILYNFFQTIKKKVGFIKPVGQKYVVVNDEQIDKDSYLIEHIFQSHVDIKLTSPIAIPSGYTEEYILERANRKDQLKNKLIYSFQELSYDREYMLVEGTGHAGVGSVLDLSNARVAKILNSKVILIAPGGIGNTIDEIMLNKALFDKEGVEVLGVVINKIYPNKIEKVTKLLTQGLNNYGLKVLGFIPYYQSLSSPNMFLVKEALKADVLNEGDTLYENIVNIVVGAMTPHYVLTHLAKGSLLITPGDREDVLLAAISLCMLSTENRLAGILITGGILPKENVFNLIKKINIPVLSVGEDTYETAKKVSNLNVKVTINDKKKIELTKQLINQLDTKYILENL
ncbi:MAG: AAA family ATPase [Candidatus Margulisbacteria bacterium]|nr:AAA family ATPase [Candidatus Margulisiibacteriota bacterium]